jgi:hypothetical protein
VFYTYVTELEAIAEPAEASGRVIPLVLYVSNANARVHPSIRPSIHPSIQTPAKTKVK